jgi:hypothetical protein
MQKPAPSPVPTRLAKLSPRAAVAVLLGLLMLVGVGLALPPDINPTGSAEGGDAALYRQTTQRVAAGADYYQAAAIEHRASAYPMKPYTAVRPPLLTEVTAMLGPDMADALLRLLAIAAATATVIRLAPAMRAPFREAAILLAATSAGAFVQSGMWVWHEVWAGLLIMLALACRTDKHWAASLALGLTAALIRELAFPFLPIMAAAAWMGGKRREAGGWLIASAAVIALLALHWSMVARVALPSDVTSPGWLALGGWRYDLALARQSSLLIALPGWVAAIVTPLALLGWCAKAGSYAGRAAALLCLWLAAFLLIGRPDNAYWGFLFAPILPIGLAFAPAALADLFKATRAARLPAALPAPARNRAATRQPI